MKILSVLFGCFIAAVGMSLCQASEPLPLYFPAAYGDARDEQVKSARLFAAEDPAWQVRLEKRGAAAGRTTVEVDFPAAVERFPLRFGIPLGQVESAKNVAVRDESGRELDADVFALVNFETSPLHWVMIATVLDAERAGVRKLTIEWGPQVTRAEPQKRFRTEIKEKEIQVRGGEAEFDLSAENLLSNIRRQGRAEVFAAQGSEVSVKKEGQKYSQEKNGHITCLFDGLYYKRFRVTAPVMEEKFVLHFEVETWAGSPYLMIHTRLIHEQKAEDRKEVTSYYELSDLGILSLRPDGRGGYQVRAGGAHIQEHRGGREIALAQRREDWSVRRDGEEIDQGFEDVLGEWVQIARGSETLSLFAPNFQGYGPGDPDLESQLKSASDGTLQLVHYRAYPEGTKGAIRFWESAARTFPLVLHIGTEKQNTATMAIAVKHPPMVKMDRAWLTEQGVFQEKSLNPVYDEVSLEGARYFARTRVGREDYPRAGRGMPPDDGGEGLKHPYTDTGGMLFGEVWQYTFSESEAWKTCMEMLKNQQEPTGNIPAWYRPRNPQGSITYRCGDHCLAMAYSYLRTGDRMVYEILRDHALLYADWAIAHPTGWCHYYCGWTGITRAYNRLDGPLMSYLVLGEPWLFETAEQMGGFLVNDWSKETLKPDDSATRSVYTARGLVQLYEVTGHRSYWHEAADRTIWFMKTGVNKKGEVYGAHNNRSNRITQLFAGYCLSGICPVYDKCRNAELLNVIERVGEWMLAKQSNPYVPENIGGWVRDTFYDGRTDNGPGNLGTITLGAVLQTWLAERTGRQDYFYSGAAAWAAAVSSTHHEGIRGGLLMQVGDPSGKIGTWSDKFPIYLHCLASLAERKGYPFVLEGVTGREREGRQNILVMPDKGGTFADGIYRQPLYAATQKPETIRVWCPQRPRLAEYEGSVVEMHYEEAKRIASVAIPGGAKPGVLMIQF